MRRGFTVIELLVVIAIAMTFASLVIPLLVEHKKKQKTQEAQRAQEAESPRFLWSNVSTSPALYASHVRDTKTGREFLVVKDAGIVEVTPPKAAEDERQALSRGD